MSSGDHLSLPPDLEGQLQGLDAPEAERLRNTWRLASMAENAAFPSQRGLDHAWDRIETHIKQGRTSAAAPSGLRLVRLRPWLAAAAVVLLAAVGLALWLRPVTVTASYGEQYRVALADGSTVILNSGTTLRYARRFGAERRVQLEGEAFFEVEPAEQPFVVATFNARVQVLGTRFNVRARPGDEDPHTAVTLDEGRVVLAPADASGPGIALAPGETRRLVGATGRPGPVDTAAITHALAWQNGDLITRNQALSDVLREVERRFDVALRLQAPGYHTRKLNLTLRRPPTAEHVIRDICGTLGLNYRPTSNGFELYGH